MHKRCGFARHGAVLFSTATSARRFVVTPKKSLLGICLARLFVPAVFVADHANGVEQPRAFTVTTTITADPLTSGGCALLTIESIIAHSARCHDRRLRADVRVDVGRCTDWMNARVK